MKARRYGIWASLAIVAAITSGALLAQAPQAIGTWVSIGDLSSPLTNGASVALPDKRTLIAGGALADGTLTDAVTIYDSVDDSAAAAGTLTSARADHTATLLKDGRVLVVGGMTADGLVSSDIEIFDPATGTSAIVALLPEPRNGHVAAALPNGNVLIAGGATVDGAILQTAVLFDPETSGVFSVPGHLHTARVHASATTMLDGRVLVAGGSNGTTELASAEIYDRYSQSFSMAATQMSVGRQGHSAVLLPDNGGVLVAGGTSNRVAQAGVDVFLPAVFPDPFSYGEGEFASTGAMTAARTGAVAGPTSVEGYAFAAAGGSPDAEVYRFATIKTDKDDYAPGELATITGSGWQPNEEVTLLFQEDPAVHDDYVLKVKADGNGNIFWNQWAPEHHDIGVRFYLTATDSRSRAQMTFTDAPKVGSVTVGGQSGTPTAGSSGTATYTVTANRGSGSGSSGKVKVEFTITGLPSGVTPSFSPQEIEIASQSDSATATLTLTTSASTPAGSTTFTVKGFTSASDWAEGPGILTVDQPTQLPSVTEVTCPINPVTYTGAALEVCTATVTGAGGLNQPLPVTYSNNTNAGTATATASFAGDATHKSSSDSKTFTIGKKVATVKANDKSKTYGDANPALDATVTGTVNGDVLAYSLATVADTTSGVGGYAITVTLGTTANYTVTPTNGTLTVDARPATVKANDKSKTYGDANPALDATVTGTVNGDVLAYSLATVADTTSGVGGYAITVTLGTTANYTVTPTNGTLTVDARPATVKANDKSKTYGDANPALDATVTGTVNGDVLAYSLATVADATSGVGGYAITVTLGTTANYTVTPTNGTLTVDARPATVKANDKSKTYGDANPALDATVTGTVNGDVLAYSLATVADATSGVGGYAITVTLGTTANYTVTPTNGTLTVNARPATVKANDKSKTYGDANPALDATVTGTVNGDVLAYSLATVADATSGVGGYAITVTLGTTANYTVTPTNGTLTVDARPATVKANDKSKTYGDANPALDATVTGTVNGDVLAYSLATTAVKFSAVGSYPIAVTLGTNPNYTVSKVDAALAVNPALATVTANAKSKTYGDDNPTLDAAVTGALNGDTLDYSLATTAVKFSSVGSYPITGTLGSNPNYTISVVNGNLTIGKRTLTVTPDGGKTKILGEVFTAFTGTVDGLQGTDTGTATYASVGAAAGATVGSYDITATFTFTNGAGSNYDVQLKTAVKGLVVLYRWDGFLQPINDTAHDVGPMSKFKTGQTIPAKFVLKNAAGATVQQTGIPTFTRTASLGACDSAAALENPEPALASVVPQYTWDGAQYHYNWSTKGIPAGLYRIFANLADGTARSVDICLTK